VCFTGLRARAGPLGVEGLAGCGHVRLHCVWNCVVGLGLRQRGIDGWYWRHRPWVLVVSALETLPPGGGGCQGHLETTTQKVSYNSSRKPSPLGRKAAAQAEYRLYDITGHTAPLEITIRPGR